MRSDGQINACKMDDQNIYVKVSRGAKFQCTDFEGGRLSARRCRGGGLDFSALESENSSAPLVAVKNDRSLISRSKVKGQGHPETKGQGNLTFDVIRQGHKKFKVNSMKIIKDHGPFAIKGLGHLKVGLRSYFTVNVTCWSFSRSNSMSFQG